MPKVKTPFDDNDATALGLIGTIHGMRHSIEVQEAEIARLTAQLMSAQKKNGPRPPSSPVGRGRSGWPADPEERKAEMARRRAKAQAKHEGRATAPPRHPRDPRHPGHAKWLKNVSNARKRVWKAMSPAKRKAHLEKMQAGRKPPKAKRQARKLPTVRMLKLAAEEQTALAS